MTSEENMDYFCFWHPLSFDFNRVILSSGTNDILYQTDQKINLAGQPSD